MLFETLTLLVLAEASLFVLYRRTEWLHLVEEEGRRPWSREFHRGRWLFRGHLVLSYGGILPDRVIMWLLKRYTTRLEMSFKLDDLESGDYPFPRGFYINPEPVKNDTPEPPKLREPVRTVDKVYEDTKVLYDPGSGDLTVFDTRRRLAGRLSAIAVAGMSTKQLDQAIRQLSTAMSASQRFTLLEMTRIGSPKETVPLYEGKPLGSLTHKEKMDILTEHCNVGAANH